MPHAAEDAAMDEAGESEAIQSFLTSQDGLYGGGGDYTIEQGDKDENAIDYEDISDEDDLPEEEQATGQLQDDNDADDLVQRLADGLNGIPDQDRPAAKTNGYHAEPVEHGEGDLFGESDDGLFGEHLSSSPDQQRAQPAGYSAGAQTHGLALPSKQSSLALPGAHVPSRAAATYTAGDSPIAVSPAMESDGYSPAPSAPEDDDDEDLDPEVRMQRDLIGMSQRRVAGEDVDSGWGAFDPEVFYSIYPRYEENRNPDFIDLFPQRPVSYRGKVPFKAPKPLHHNKLSLDILQDQEKTFKTVAIASKQDLDALKPGLVLIGRGGASQDDSDDDLAWSVFDENERIGGVTANDLALLCEDWEMPDTESQSEFEVHDEPMDGSWELQERARPRKRQRIDILDTDFSISLQDAHLPFEEPERAAAKLAKSVALDMNDPNLLIDELEPQAPRRVKQGEPRRDVATTKDLAKRYNISNDEAYDLLKENHQHKIRSTLGSMAVEHSLPATKLQFPFYKVNLDSSVKRSFHRPHLDIRDAGARTYRFRKLERIKKKNVRGRDAKDLFGKAEDLYLGDNASLMLLEYSEEAPMSLSNFGMGNRLINYYRKRNADDQERPKRDIGETQVLLTQDKSPFANFGHVDQGEIVPTIQNGLYRAPVFEHKAKQTDFLIGMSTTYENGNRFYIRNIENLHVVGQQFPLSEVPTEHSRKVTDASKKRLRAISYRIHTKAVDPTRPGKVKPLNNENIMRHLPGHDMPQTRSKMREFMKYERAPGKDSGGIWVPPPGSIVPDAETLRSWIKPEDVCLLESMQVGVQYLTDLGLYSNSKEGDEDKDVDDSANLEVKLAPWNATKNFLNACQGKAMLKLHGEGDPTRRGEGFDFIKTSMKGGFQALGESAQDKLDAKKRKETGGHSYNVAKQQKAYDSSIRWIWDKQKQSLSSAMDLSDTEMDDEPEAVAEANDTYGGRAQTPRSALGGTPSAFGRQDDESASQFSRNSTHGDKVMIITRYRPNSMGEMVPFYERITDNRIIKAYKKKTMEKRLAELSALDLNPTGDPEEDEFRRQQIQKELDRINRNVKRSQMREKAKGKGRGGRAANSPAENGNGAPTNGDGSPGPANGASNRDGGSAAGTPQKTGRGRNKDGTARKCANCGQVGHIKTNRKLCPLLNGTMKPEDAAIKGDSSFGAVPAPLTL